jgi:hypothetical protein
MKAVAKSGAQRGAARLLPAGDAQLQFEITAFFALAVAEIHGMTRIRRMHSSTGCRMVG